MPAIAKKRIKWEGAVARIYSAAALAWPAVTEFDGLVIDDAIDSDGIVTLTMEVTTDFLEGPLLTVEFTGGGGASGEAAMRGVLKPAGFGTMENIEPVWRSEEHTSELQSLMRISYAVFCLKKKTSNKKKKESS